MVQQKSADDWIFHEITTRTVYFYSYMTDLCRLKTGI
jgi:hypothetical protein